MQVVNARLRLNLSQFQVAEKMSVSVRWVQRIESGAKLPGFYLAMRLIAFLQIDMQELLAAISNNPEQQSEAGSAG